MRSTYTAVLNSNHTMHFAIVPTVPSVESYAYEVAEELASNGCDVVIDIAYENEIQWRVVAETDNVITLSKKDKQRSTVTVYYRPERKYTTHEREYFIRNWRHLMD